jgi:hypothetical protein
VTEDEIDAAIAQQACLNILKKGASGGAHEMAREALRLQREGWRPEPKRDPLMVKAIDVFHAAHAAWDDIRNKGTKAKINSGAGVIADAIAQAVADARVKVPADVRSWAKTYGATTYAPQRATASFIDTLIAAEDGQ